MQSYILGSRIWWYGYKSLELQNKLTAHLLIFNKVTSVLNIFERHVSHFIFKLPVMLRLTEFRINTSYLAKI